MTNTSQNTLQISVSKRFSPVNLQPNFNSIICNLFVTLYEVYNSGLIDLNQMI